MEKKHRNISLEVIGVLRGMSLHWGPKLRCWNRTKTKHTSFGPPPRKKMPRETGPCWKEKNLPTNVFGGYVSFLGRVSCSWNFWGCDHEPNQRWAGSLDHLWRIYRELLRVKKSKSLVLEKVLILAIPKAYQIDSDVKLKPNIHFFWCHICHHFLARGAPANIIHSIVLYVIKVLNTRTSPNSGSPLELLYFFPPHRWTAGIPGISSDWS